MALLTGMRGSFDLQVEHRFEFISEQLSYAPYHLLPPECVPTHKLQPHFLHPFPSTSEEVHPDHPMGWSHLRCPSWAPGEDCSDWGRLRETDSARGWHPALARHRRPGETGQDQAGPEQPPRKSVWTDREVSRSQELGPGWALCLPSRPWAVLPSCFLRLSASGCMRRGPGAPQTPRLIWVLVSVVVKNPPPSAGGARDSGSIRGSGRTPGRGNGNPLQYSCPGNPHGQRRELHNIYIYFSSGEIKG